MKSEYEKAIQDPKRKARIDNGYVKLVEDELRNAEKDLIRVTKRRDMIKKELSETDVLVDQLTEDIIILKNEISKVKRLQVPDNGG